MRRAQELDMGFPNSRGTVLGPHNKDYSIFGYIGVPLSWETTTWLGFRSLGFSGFGFRA